MSAIAVAVGTDGIIVASDGVCYTYETGKVSGILSKIILMPEYNCFIGATGAGGFMTALRWEIEQQITCFDDLVAGFADFCMITHRKLFTNVLGQWERGAMTEVSCVIGGWSDEREAYETYRVVSYDKESVDLSDGRKIRLEPFDAQPLPSQGIWCSMMPEKATMDEFALNPPHPNDENIDILSRLICACRADSGFSARDGEDEARFQMVGGFLQLTVLQRGSIHSVIAHQWNEDVIGATIDPVGEGRFPAWLRERHEKAKLSAANSSDD